jgi:hypothetical protein
MPDQWPLEPEWIDQIKANTDAMIAKQARVYRAFWQGLATGIVGTTMVLLTVWYCFGP